MDHADQPSIASTYARLLQECINAKSLTKGKIIHTHMIKTGFKPAIFLGNRLIDMYSKCMNVMDAQQLFDKMSERDVFTWNNLIAGHVRNGSIEDARQVFDKIPERDTVSWNSIIAGCSQLGNEEEALKLFRRMQRESLKPTQFTFASLLRACASLPYLQQGKQIHASAIKFGFQVDVFMASALVDMYSKCRSVEDARQVFDRMPERNVVSWNAMISGYSQNGHGEEAMELFRQMQFANLNPDHSTLACVLSACACLTALGHGKQVQGYITKVGFEENVFVGSALVDIYAKCGSIEEARQVFDKMPDRNTVSWSSMIVGYAQNGLGRDALQLFEQMRLALAEPDRVTFVGVLTACSHAGLVDEGWHYFHSMMRDHGIVPDVDHYACMIDLLGRAGHLDKAEDFIDNMPVEPDAAMWGALIGACRIHGNIKLAERAAYFLFELEPQNAGPYLLLAHMYAANGSWDDVARVRKLMKERGVRKEPGCSWTEVNNAVHTFMADDIAHQQAEEIYRMLQWLVEQIEVVGYVPHTNTLSQDANSENRERIHVYHSEKMAIAFALINTSSQTTIRIVKNLRVCGDCHTFTKFVSKVVGRQIILRDNTRFHHFKDGLCSCGDYW